MKLHVLFGALCGITISQCFTNETQWRTNFDKYEFQPNHIQHTKTECSRRFLCSCRLNPVFLHKKEMPVFLFDDLIFGPVKSRRLGISLGINLLPLHKKLCSFDCLYCECGWTKNRSSLKIELPGADELSVSLEKKLRELSGTDMQPDSITFAGNGEPTMHPEFASIIKNTLLLRDKYAPKAKVSVLSNGSMLHLPEVVNALKMVDNNLLKLDGGREETIQAINMPLKAFRLKEYVKQLQRLDGKLIIQTLLLRGMYKGKLIDNTSEQEIDAWIGLLKQIRPQRVMVYAIERDTPTEGLIRISKVELEHVAQKVRSQGIEAEVFA